MTLIKWKRSNSIFDIMDNYNILNNYLRSDNYSYYDGEWNPLFNINEKGKSYNIVADMPGLEKKDININIDDDMIVISGNRKTINNKNDKLLCSEIRYGNFERRFHLPEDVNMDKIDASLKNGVLDIEIQKTKPIKSKLRQINIS